MKDTFTWTFDATQNRIVVNVFNDINYNSITRVFGPSVWQQGIGHAVITICDDFKDKYGYIPEVPFIIDGKKVVVRV